MLLLACEGRNGSEADALQLVLASSIPAKEGNVSDTVRLRHLRVSDGLVD